LAIILAAAVPKLKLAKSILTFLLPDKEPSQIFLSPMGFLATVLMVMGAIIRFQCYRELGRHFTFEVTILNNHKLITSGPYSYVRHPGYTGAYISLAGIAMWYTAQGSWLRESEVYKMPLAWIVLAPVVAYFGLLISTLFRRISVEDEILKKTFGKEWDEWAKKVPARLFPGIY
jgi:protein-S-isoprenylcysteine O-methyltransferase Ste14